MFSSIKWKFVVVYVSLVLIAMTISGVFIVQEFEEQQLENRTNTMIKQIRSLMISTSSYLSEDDWTEYSEELQNILNGWRFSGTEMLYVVYEIDIPRIIASSHVNYGDVNGENALSRLDPTLIIDAYNDGEIKENIKMNPNEDTVFKHLAYPIVNEVGKVNGILYMTDDIQDVYKTVNETKRIIISATIFSLLITIFLGVLISNSITVPIRDVTKKAEKMAKGDFDQFVEVKSDDEIGQLASMFNYLTLKLKDTIGEMELEKSKLNTIFNYMADGVISVDVNKNLVHANPVALDILKTEDITEDDLQNLSPFPLEMINLEDINFNDIDTLEGERTISINKSIYQLEYAPFRNEENKIGGVIIVFQDITKHHELDKMRNEFVANVSHELKTPITTIKAYTETLIDDTNADKEISQGFLKVINDECDRMTRILKELLQLSNLDYNKTKWNMVECQIEEIIEDACVKLKPSINKKNQSLILDIEDNLPDVVIDKDGIQQVILNILSNSIKYTADYGEIQLSAHKHSDFIALKFTDNGIGIPKEDQPRIFERFYRVDKGRSRESGGTGLGLSIAKEIVDAHGGEMKLKSEYELGTEVTIILPLKELAVIET